MKSRQQVFGVGLRPYWSAGKRRIACVWQARSPRRHLPITDWKTPKWQGMIVRENHMKTKQRENFGNQIRLRAS